jgi:DNA-directed RNA polymerase specialized sigma24 family protein
MQLPVIIHFMKLRKPEVQMEMRGYSKTKKKDVFNKRNYYEGKLELHSIHNSVSGNGDDLYLEVLPDNSNPEAEIIQKLDTERILNRLSSEERQVVEMKSSGFNIAEISNALQLKPQRVNHTLEQFKSKFENGAIHQLEIHL